MSYYEKRIAELEARVQQLAREQRLKAIPIEAQLLERYALMQAENKRLRKAGDKMYAYITDVILDGRISSPFLNKLQDDWDNAAKDGKAAE